MLAIGTPFDWTIRSMRSSTRRATTSSACVSEPCSESLAMPIGSTGSAGKVPPATCRAASSSAGWNALPTGAPIIALSRRARDTSPVAMCSIAWNTGPMSMPRAARWAIHASRGIDAPSAGASAMPSGAEGRSIRAVACQVQAPPLCVATPTVPSGRAIAATRTGASSSRTGSGKTMSDRAAVPEGATASMRAIITAPGTTTRPCTR